MTGLINANLMMDGEDVFPLPIVRDVIPSFLLSQTMRIYLYPYVPSYNSSHQLNLDPLHPRVTFCFPLLFEIDYPLLSFIPRVTFFLSSSSLDTPHAGEAWSAPRVDRRTSLASLWAPIPLSTYNLQLVLSLRLYENQPVAAIITHESYHAMHSDQSLWS